MKSTLIIILIVIVISVNAMPRQFFDENKMEEAVQKRVSSCSDTGVRCSGNDECCGSNDCKFHKPDSSYRCLPDSYA